MQLLADAAAPRRAIPVWALAGMLHLVCTAACLALAVHEPALLPGASWCWLEGAIVALLGALAGMPVWWLAINLLFVPVAYAQFEWQIPAGVYLAAFCVVGALNASAWRQRVPLFLSSAKATAALGARLPPQAGFRLLDLGCGTGSVLAALARARPDGCYHGIESSPLSCLVAWWRVRTRARARVEWGDFWGANLAQYDVVYAYLSPAPMARLWDKARREMKPGSLFISNTFEVPGVAPAHTVAVGDRVRATLLIWRM